MRNIATGRFRDIYALLDTGSNRDVIDEDVVDELEIPCKSELMEVRVLGGDSIGPRRVASYIVESIEDDYTAAVPNAMVATLLTTQSDIPPSKRDLSNHGHLSNLPFIDINDGIGMIIGVSHCLAWTGENCKSIRGPPGSPMGLWTLFGWTIQGGGGVSGAGSVN